MKLLIVESPSKAKTINQYLGKDYQVLASYGHLRALPSEKDAVLPDDNFSMKFKILDKSKKNLDAIMKSYKRCDELLLATDPDREGEAISWHIIEALKEKKIYNSKIPIKRVVFNEITKNAIINAIQNPRDIDSALVSAQQARQALDYLVGFTLSPVLWRKLPGSRSAGRVQSVALRIIAERDNEIEKFHSQEYWSIEAKFKTSSNDEIESKLYIYNKNKLEKLTISSESQAQEIVGDLLNKAYKVSGLDLKEIIKQPPAPFTTSTMLQESAKKIGFSAKKTAKIAQDLYEGMEFNGQSQGIITYMRTDSVDISQDALKECRHFIDKKFGQPYLPKTARKFKNKTKNVQEAHEAIRPTNINLTPEMLKSSISLDHYKLYSLIWQRTIASQMSNALLESTTVTISDKAEDNKFRATGTIIKFDGFLKLFINNKSLDDEIILPATKINETLITSNIDPHQHFTQPAARFTEASLIKKLEDLGIGRPSTYPTIIAVLKDREYVTFEKKRFTTLAKGRIVNAFLTSFFEKYVEYNFTAMLENQLDDISNGLINSIIVLKNFWNPFKEQVDKILLVKISDILNEMEVGLNNYLFENDEHICSKCKTGEMKLKNGKFGPFLGCSNYPECKNIQKINDKLDNHPDENNTATNSNATENKTELTLPFVIGSADDWDYTIKKGPYGTYIEAVKAKDVKRMAVPTNKALATINLDYAIKLISLPRILGPYNDGIIKAGLGKFGPYLECDGKYYSIKGQDPISITFEEAKEFITLKIENTDVNKASTKKSINSKFIKKVNTYKNSKKG